MGAKRQFVLMRSAQDGDSPEPLGKLPDVEAFLSRYNIAPDGSTNGMGTKILHGPGMVVEVPLGLDRITQVIVTLNDDDFSWPVLMRLCSKESLAMVDLESGRSFGPG